MYEHLMALLKKRRSIRRFKPDPVPEGAIEKILEAARWSMSGANGQPWEFLVVRDPSLREKVTAIVTEQTQRAHIYEMCRVEELRQPQLARPTRTAVGQKEAPVVIVVLGDPRVYQATAMSHFVFSPEFDNFHMSLGCTTLLIHLAAASLGLGSRWVTIMPPWEEDLKTVLGIPKEFRIYNLIPIGYPAYEPPTTYRRELKEFVHYDKYDMVKFRSDEEVLKYLVELRNKTRPAYTVEKSSW